jgi:hypothetical protein
MFDPDTNLVPEPDLKCIRFPLRQKDAVAVPGQQLCKLEYLWNLLAVSLVGR